MPQVGALLATFVLTRVERNYFSVATMIALPRRPDLFAQQPAFTGSGVTLYRKGMFDLRPRLGRLAHTELTFALPVMCAAHGLGASFAAAVLEPRFGHYRAIAQVCVGPWRNPSGDAVAVNRYSRTSISILGD